jgi:tellurite methyltransferase
LFPLINQVRVMSEDWASYYQKTGQGPPRQTLIRALELFETERTDPSDNFAIDLGSGNGRDTIELLQQGWTVTAIDAEKSALDGLMNRSDLPSNPNLKTIQARFEDIYFPYPVDLVNSSFALPLVPPERFPDLWDKILFSLRPGGRISCQLYGNKDSWVGNPTITFFNRDGIKALLNPLETEFFREEEDDGPTPRGQNKHWHIFHIVARKA